MTVHKINFSVFGGESSPWFPTRCVSHEQVEKYIHAQEYDPIITAKLIRMSRSYPTNALASFVKNLRSHVAKVRKENDELS